MSKEKRFSVLSLIGEGGMGKVLKVHDKAHDRFCALKITKTAESATDKQSLREAAVWFSFRRYGHIVEVFEILPYGGDNIAIIMEYMPLGNIRRFFKNSPPTRETISMLLFDVSSALSCCAKEVPGFVHLDIKPENCLIAEHGLVKLTDFGLSMSANPHLLSQLDLSHKNLGLSMAYRTEAGIRCMGTPLYMSPEQISNQYPVSEKSDIYSLGLMAVELIVGAHPCARLESSREVFDWHLMGKAFQAARESLQTKDYLDDIVLSCLHEDPNKRPSVSELNTHLKHKMVRQLGYLDDELEKFPDPVGETTRIAHSMRSLGRKREAISHLERCLSMDIYQASSWALLAEWYWHEDVLPVINHTDLNNQVKNALPVLMKVFTYCLRALLLETSTVKLNDKAKSQCSILYPQMIYQVIDNVFPVNKPYQEWVHDHLAKEKTWFEQQQKEMVESGTVVRSLCIKCGELRLNRLVRCPRCGFVPLEWEELFLSNVLSAKNVDLSFFGSKGSGRQTYQRMRELGKRIDEVVKKVKGQEGYGEALADFASKSGEMYTLAHRMANELPVRSEKKTWLGRFWK